MHSETPHTNKQVADCAEHPADIKVTTWSQVSCAECEEEAFNGATPVVVCPADDSSTTSSTSTGETDDGGVGGADDDGSVGDGGVVGEEQTAPPTTVGTPEVVVDGEERREGFAGLWRNARVDERERGGMLLP